jgi:hypothetical protein
MSSRLRVLHFRRDWPPKLEVSEPTDSRSRKIPSHFSQSFGNLIDIRPHPVLFQPQPSSFLLRHITTTIYKAKRAKMYMRIKPVFIKPGDLFDLRGWWKDRESQWPSLVRMAFDMMAISAISSERKRLFSFPPTQILCGFSVKAIVMSLPRRSKRWVKGWV